MNSSERLATLRHAIARGGMDGLLVPRADEHLGEYVPPCAERLAWLTGFTGSAGLAIVLQDRAAVFTDGRYTTQLARETDAASFELRHSVDDPAPEWLAAQAPGLRIGYDPWLMSEEGVARFTAAGVEMVACPANPIDQVWTDRPAPPAAPAFPHPLEFAGQGSAEKRRAVGAVLAAAKQDAAVLSDPASLAWLLNLRGADLEFVPVALGFALLRADGRATVFMDAAKLDCVRDWLGPDVTCAGREALEPALAALGGQRVRVDAAGTPAWFASTLRAAGAELVAGMDPCALPRACKNAVEQEGARIAHRTDGVALCRFLHWLDAEGRGATEMQAVARLRAFRAEHPACRGESFPAISGAGEHGAIIHYRVSPETDRVIGADVAYLIDSGGQYPMGTTDVTRTIWTGPGDPPAELRDRYTRVLQGHIALATAVFPEGVAGPHLDAFARRALWDAGLDYDHGTGHGVGSYLSVHEGPASLSRAGRMTKLAAGMILSDEPGFYLPGAYGIRLENLLIVQPAETGSVRPFLRFETLTLAPFDRRLVAIELLSGAERAWLRAYHARVLSEVMLDGAAREWLTEGCASWNE